MINFITGFTQGYFHFVFNVWDWNNSKGQSTAHWGSVYWTVMVVALIISVCTAVFWTAEEEDWKLGLRWGTTVLTGSFAWPYVLFAGLVALVLAGPVAIILAWFDLLPSKEQRIEKRAKKVADLRGKIEKVSA